MIPDDDNPHGYRFFHGGFPDSYEGAVFKTDFRVWLRWAVVGRRPELSGAERLTLGIRLCYRSYPKGANPSVLADGLAWFGECGESDRVAALKYPAKVFDTLAKINESQRDKPPVFDYFWDFKDIWASFKGSYGIDLYTADLHWWGFTGLLHGLPETSPLSRTLSLRTREIKNKMTPAEYMPIKMAALPKTY